MSEIAIRSWQDSDDARLIGILQLQLAADPTWPPAYAHNLDLRDWLARPADLARWVCTSDDQVDGHIGLGSLTERCAEEFSNAMGHGEHRFAELCRTVVDPHKRKLGIAGALTRTALKASIGLGRIPVATVLTGRGTWLEMMIESGWQRIGDIASRSSDERLVLLLAPARFVDGAVRNGR